jgi:malonyl-CoA/methylmalonyl-CoA synthetase
VSSSQLIARWLVRAKETRAAACHDQTGTTPWCDAVDAADRVASALLDGRASLEGERVALLVSPGSTFVASLFGVLRAGGTAVVLSPLHPAPEIRYFCDDARVRTVLASSDLADRVRFLAPERRIALAASLLERPVHHEIIANPGDEDAALQLYTSGTTGKPKGVIITHANVAVQQELLGAAWGLTEGDVLLHVLPLHHMHGLAIALLSAIGAGAATRFLSPPPAPNAAAFDAAATWEAMAASSVLMAVPTIHAKLFAAFDAADEATRARWKEHACSLRRAVAFAHGSVSSRTLRHDRDRRGVEQPPRAERAQARHGGHAPSNGEDARRRRRRSRRCRR